MLVLKRRLDQAIVIDGNIVVKILDVKRSHVKIGITAPEGVPILRQEILDRAERANS